MSSLCNQGVYAAFLPGCMLSPPHVISPRHCLAISFGKWLFRQVLYRHKLSHRSTYKHYRLKVSHIVQWVVLITAHATTVEAQWQSRLYSPSWRA